ncbi:MAG: helix-turn-helix domain-containing protein, partial [Gammaproteobacteria bacterium]
LATAIQNGEVAVEEVTGLDTDRIKMLRQAIEQHAEDGRLKSVFEALQGEYDYNVLRCVKASM